MQIKLGAHRIPVREIDQESLDELWDGDESKKPLGLCFLRHNGGYEIWVADWLKGVARISIFSHEIVEAVNEIYELGLPHDKVTLVGEVITQLILDNKRAVKETFGL